MPQRKDLHEDAFSTKVSCNWDHCSELTSLEARNLDLYTPSLCPIPPPPHYISLNGCEHVGCPANEVWFRPGVGGGGCSLPLRAIPGQQFSWEPQQSQHQKECSVLKGGSVWRITAYIVRTVWFICSSRSSSWSFVSQECSFVASKCVSHIGNIQMELSGTSERNIHLSFLDCKTSQVLTVLRLDFPPPDTLTNSWKPMFKTNFLKKMYSSMHGLPGYSSYNPGHC